MRTVYWNTHASRNGGEFSGEYLDSTSTRIWLVTASDIGADFGRGSAILECPRYFNLSATLSRPALAHASSMGHPGAPLTAIAPITSLPTMMGSPPPMSMVPSTGGFGMVPSCSGMPSPVFLAQPSTTSFEGRRYTSAVYAFLCAMSKRCRLAPPSWKAMLV